MPPTWRAFDEFNVQFLRRYVRRPAALGGEAPPPAPVVGANGQVEHEVAEILKFRVSAGRPQVLIRWAGLDASGDTWEPLDHLTNCEEAIQAFESARGVVLPRPPRAPPAAGCGGAPPPVPPPGYTVEVGPGPLGAALVGRFKPGWCCTGGQRTAGSSARWLGCVVAHLSLMLSHTIGARLRCEARSTHC